MITHLCDCKGGIIFNEGIIEDCLHVESFALLSGACEVIKLDLTWEQRELAMMPWASYCGCNSPSIFQASSSPSSAFRWCAGYTKEVPAQLAWELIKTTLFTNG